MISPKEYAKKWRELWGKEPIKFSATILEGLEVDEEVKIFLLEGGLPDEAPLLTFEAESSLYAIEEDMSDYKYIGSTNWGDPICLYEGDGSVVYLDHENDYEYETFVNSSIPQLAESLLVYSQMMKEAQKENGEDAILDNNIPERLKKWVFEELKRIDPPAVEDGFWQAELESLDEEE